MRRKDTVPGYLIRSEAGDLIGVKCPLSNQTFRGEDAERDQYRHTLSIMEAQGLDVLMSIAERRSLYERGIGR